MILIALLIISLCLLMTHNKEAALFIIIVSIPMTLFASAFTYHEVSRTKVSNEISAITQNKYLDTTTILVKNGNQMEKVQLGNYNCKFIIKENKSPDVLETTTVKRKTTQLLFPFVFYSESESYNIYLSEEQVIQHRL